MGIIEDYIAKQLEGQLTPEQIAALFGGDPALTLDDVDFLIRVTKLAADEYQRRADFLQRLRENNDNPPELGNLEKRISDESRRRAEAQMLNIKLSALYQKMAAGALCCICWPFKK